MENKPPGPNLESGPNNGGRPSQIGKAYGIHPQSIHAWKREFMENGPDLFDRDGLVSGYEGRISELERLLGKKVAMVKEVKQDYGLAPALAALDLARSTWYYHGNHGTVLPNQVCSSAPSSGADCSGASRVRIPANGGGVEAPFWCDHHPAEAGGPTASFPLGVGHSLEHEGS